jgi:hypothetical protein
VVSEVESSDYQLAEGLEVCLDHLRNLQMKIHLQRDLLEAEMYFAALHTNLKKENIILCLPTINPSMYSCPPENSINTVVAYASILVFNLTISSRHNDFSINSVALSPQANYTD